MSKRRKPSRRQRKTLPSSKHQRRGQPIKAKPVRLLRLLPQLGNPIDEPLLVRSRVTVLIKGGWADLNAMLQNQAKPDTGSEALNALDSLVEVAAPILAQHALQNYMREQGLDYRRLLLQAFSFHPSTSQQSATTIWGELTPDDIAPAVERALTIAAQIRVTFPKLPTDIFWPFVGSFFSSVDSSPHVGPQTWANIAITPQKYILLNVLITSHYGSVSKIIQDVREPSAADSSSGWRLCFRCGRASQLEEYILWDDRQFCPYWCGGEIEWDSGNWEYARVINPTHPREPQKWCFYPELSEDPEHAIDYGEDC